MRSVRAVVVLLVTLSAPVAAQLTADFSADVIAGTNPLTVQFEDLTTGGQPIGWLWNFGDGGGSQSQDPLHVYDTPGTYTVSLTVLESLFTNHVVTKRDFITVLPADLAPDFVALTPTSGTNPLEVSFADTSTGAPLDSWLWDFGDGSTSTEASPTHVFGTPGGVASYDVSLTIGSGGQSATVVMPDLVQVAPASIVPAFEQSVAGGVGQVAVTFSDLTDGPVDGWLWDFGDGATSTEAQPTHVYAVSAPTRFDVSLTAFIGQQSASVTVPSAVAMAPGLFPASETVADSVGGFEVLFEDLDGDSVLDLVTTRPDGVLVHFDDGAGGYGDAIPVLGTTGTSFGTIAVGDLDGDGDVDVLPGGADVGAFGWHANDSVGGFSSSILLADGFFPRIGPAAIGDLDQDGDLDLVLGHANGIDGFGGGAADLMQNDGTGQFVKFAVVSTGFWLQQDLWARDLDLDGDVDVLVQNPWTAGGSNVRWVEQDGPEWHTEVIMGSTEFLEDVDVGDLDGDGNLDVVASWQHIASSFGEPGPFPAQLEVSYGDGLGGFEPGVLLADLEEDALGALALLDLDRDGDDDLLVSRSDQQQLWWLEPTTAGFLPQWLGTPGNSGSPRALIDFDGDEDPDLYFTNGAGLQRMPNQLASPTWPHTSPGLASEVGLPWLSAAGEPSGGELVSLVLGAARPGAVSTLVFGLSSLQAPFRAGIMGPEPDILVMGIPVDVEGRHTHVGVWPGSFPVGTEVYAQHWILDPGGPVGFAASNTVRGTAWP